MTQSATDTYNYEPYGAYTHTLGASVNGYLFAGQSYDFNSNLYFMRNRYYLPAIGRFISRDPAGLGAGVNPYIYAGDNPISMKDPAGMDGIGGTPPGGFGIGDPGAGDDPAAGDPGAYGCGGGDGGDGGNGDESSADQAQQAADTAAYEAGGFNGTVENGQGYYSAGYGYGAEGVDGGFGFGGPGVGGGPAHGPRLMFAQFSGYNYCGPGNNGGPTQPGTLDNCCKAYDQCYGQNGLSADSVSIFPPGLGLDRLSENVIGRSVTALKTMLCRLDHMML